MQNARMFLQVAVNGRNVGAKSPARAVAGAVAIGVLFFFLPAVPEMTLQAQTAITDAVAASIAPQTVVRWAGVLPHYVACIAVSLVVAVASYHLLEKPFLKLKRYF